MFVPPPWLFILFFARCVLANTEIVNFSFKETNNATVPPIEPLWLDPTTSERVLSIVPIRTSDNMNTLDELSVGDSELWVELRAESEPWSTYDHFTVRISSPASLARVRARHIGVSASYAAATDIEPASFVITMEPLLLGVLPQSVLPFLGVAAVSILVALRFVLPWVTRQLDGPLANLQRLAGSRAEGITGDDKRTE
ncbi:hypothetical protein K525DRAFT_282364 [Schizophyllum commune Loenen D]|nr:hypothetical protein K525DRAFT_282364 [Schizophyllum commune Loenen D]